MHYQAGNKSKYMYSRCIYVKMWVVRTLDENRITHILFFSD